ncbi:Bug family tripartite tricarboxylate transporter substrate binding protein [Rhodoplanes sp. Z2-YC6860]|uniref:Bug family tripartite tricarboxylate transporter substrate binding protein n=1 Tax=Rhodoplanes sp. Z2-YC6860 TaxID=674703 RepID=UPI0018DB7635|nr:tripartite tricarboxylate transporter substrate binding protein [Rhodoplanes sp. Z2-YC6860]
MRFQPIGSWKTSIPDSTAAGRSRPCVLSWLRLWLAIALTIAAPLRAQAESSWPTRAVTIIVPNAPGGFTDIMARMAADHLTRKFGQAFIVENRPGGAGVIGATQVATAQPDGYTFLFTSPSTILTQPLLQKVSYDPDSLIPISVLGNLPFLLGIKSSLPPKSLPEFIAYAKANPDKLNYASAGVGGIGYLVSVLFLKTAGLSAVHVPYKSAAPATAALLSGEVDMYFAGSPEMMQHLTSDRIRILATSGAKRLAKLPDTPAVAEFYPGFQVSTWEAFMAPPGTPKSIVDAMVDATAEVSKDPMIIQRFAALGVATDGTTQEEFFNILKRDRAFYEDAINTAGIEPAAKTSRPSSKP